MFLSQKKVKGKGKENLRTPFWRNKSNVVNPEHKFPNAIKKRLMGAPSWGEKSNKLGRGF